MPTGSCSPTRPCPRWPWPARRSTRSWTRPAGPGDGFRVSNFWAWHVKDTREEAEREARIWLALRGVLLRANHTHFMTEAEMDIVDAKRGAFFDALRRRSPDIQGVPDHIVRLLVDNLTSCAAVDDLGREIDRLRAFEKAGLTEIALRIYDEPEKTIRTLGEQVIPALGSP